MSPEGRAKFTAMAALRSLMEDLTHEGSPSSHAGAGQPATTWVKSHKLVLSARAL